MNSQTPRNRFALVIVKPLQAAACPWVRGRQNVDSLTYDRPIALGSISRDISHRVTDSSEVGSPTRGYISKHIRSESSPHFEGVCHSSSSPCAIPSLSTNSMPPLPRYRSQENIFMSPLYPKENHGSLKPRRMSVSKIITYSGLENEAQNIYSNYQKGEVLKGGNDDDKKCHKISTANAFDDGYLPMSQFDKNYINSSQRRRASIVTIHMNPSPNLDPNSKLNFRIASLNNNLPNLQSNSAYPYSSSHHPQNRTDSIERRPPKLQSKFCSSVDLTFPEQQPKLNVRKAHQYSRRFKTSPSETESNYRSKPPSQMVQERNLFKIYLIKIKSIASPSDDESQIKSCSEFEEPKKEKSTASIKLVYKDFDDMIANMLEAKEQASQGNLRSLADAQLYFAGQVSSKEVIPPVNVEHSEKSRKRACDHLLMVILKHRIDKFNKKYPQYGLNLLPRAEIFEGSIQVFMNLIRPVELDRSGTRGLIQLPRDTFKVHLITSETSTKEVIRKLLKEFNIKENPRKFALYHKHTNEGNKVLLRRLDPDEYPLRMYLDWSEKEEDWYLRHSLLLQENDTGDVEWDLFSLPELESFLRMLNKEEKKFIEEVKLVYRTIRIIMENRIKELQGTISTGNTDDVMGEDV